MGICTPIFDNVFVDCNFPNRVDGDTAYLINYDDILYVEFNGYPPQNIRTIKEHRDIIKLYLKGGTYIYTIEGKNNTVKSGYYEFELLYSDVFAHWVDLKIFDSNLTDLLTTKTLKEQLEILPKGKYVMIVENEVYGIFSGLVLMTKEKNSSEDNQYTYYSLEFETEDQKVEPHLPNKYLGDIDWLQSDHWIVWDNWWDDSGLWFDTETWKD